MYGFYDHRTVPFTHTGHFIFVAAATRARGLARGKLSGTIQKRYLERIYGGRKYPTSTLLHHRMLMICLRYFWNIPSQNAEILHSISKLTWHATCQEGMVPYSRELKISPIPKRQMVLERYN